MVSKFSELRTLHLKIFKSQHLAKKFVLKDCCWIDRILKHFMVPKFTQLRTLHLTKNFVLKNCYCKDRILQHFMVPKFTQLRTLHLTKNFVLKDCYCIDRILQHFMVPKFSELGSLPLDLGKTLVYLEYFEHIIKFCIFINIFELMFIIIGNCWNFNSIIWINHDQIPKEQKT